jgi:endonuclease/exonuclease/phosphatase family metal-dependent hydrolase
MTAILSWNIQNGRGVDGIVSLDRIAQVIGAMGSPDVICLQEVSRGLELAGAGAPDQPAELAALFPGYETIFGVAVDADPEGRGTRWKFGNLVLSRLPVLSVQHHTLPRPPASGIRHMVRQASEIVVKTGEGPLRVINTHLEFHSTAQRAAQISGLRAILDAAFGHAEFPPLASAQGPYHEGPMPGGAVICGDFNMEVGSAEYRHMTDPFAGGRIADAWVCANPARPHDPTCGVHDDEQWPQGPHCRDFFFLTGRAIGNVHAVTADTFTAASDHQPLMLELADRPA